MGPLLSGFCGGGELIFQLVYKQGMGHAFAMSICTCGVLASGVLLRLGAHAVPRAERSVVLVHAGIGGACAARGVGGHAG
jgi:hypothetical protein